MMETGRLITGEGMASRRRISTGRAGPLPAHPVPIQIMDHAIGLSFSPLRLRCLADRDKP
jgi:hypothetical protein